MEKLDEKTVGIMTIILYDDDKNLKKYTIQNGFENDKSYSLNCFHASYMLEDFKEFIVLTEAQCSFEETFYDIDDYYKRLTFPITSDKSYIEIDHSDLKKQQLIAYKPNVLIYSKIECNAILDYTEFEFFELIKNDVMALLVVIDKFKPSDMKFEFPTDISSLSHVANFNFQNYKEDDFYDELEYLYKNIILIYSSIFSNNIYFREFRSRILTLLEFIKHCTGILTFQMETYGFRIYHYMEDYFNIKFYKRGYNIFNCKSSDTIILHEKEIKKLKPMVSDYIIELDI